MGKLSKVKQAVDKALDMRAAARMKRAEEMGFDTSQVYYHGTTRDIDAFSIPNDGRFSLHGKGVYFAQDPKKARFADQEGGNIVPAYIRGRMGSEADLRDATEALGSRLSVGGHGARAELINNEMRSRGFTGYRAGDQSIVFDPSNIRSVSAAFDPAKRESSNLLAGLGGAGILGALMLTPEQAAAADSFAAQDNDGIYADEFPTLDRIGTLMNKLNLPIVGRPLEGTANYLQRLGEPRSKWDRAKDSAGAALDLL